MAVPPSFPSISDYFNHAIDFFHKYQWIYNYPNTHILVKKVFDDIPQEWVPLLQNLTVPQLNNLALGEVPGNAPASLIDFFREIKRLKVKQNRRNFCIVPLKLPNLSRKKEHELLTLAPLVHEICEETGCNYVIDVGTGVGYLPQLLFDNYKYKVLGIEGDREKIRLANLNQQKFPNSLESVKFVKHFVTEESEAELRGLINVEGNSYCITGLHACADLSVTILDLFMKLEFVKALVIMPCCYHRLKQVDGKFDNFPVSQELKKIWNEKQLSSLFQVPFLRLACQSSGESFSLMTQKQHEEHANNCLFRAILQEVAFEENCDVKRIKRKTGGKCLNFASYVSNLKNTHTLIGANINEGEFLTTMHEKWRIHKEKTWLIEALMGFQAAIQDICENFVLLDRVGFLLEKGVKCFVVQVTDRGMSPRSHALVAVKT